MMMNRGFANEVLHKLKSWTFFHQVIILFSGVRFKGAVSRYSVIFALFLREQKMATAHAKVADISSVGRANSFTAPAESSNCRFPRPGLVAAIIFPHTKWLPKITDYRDIAVLRAFDQRSKHNKLTRLMIASPKET